MMRAQRYGSGVSWVTVRVRRIDLIGLRSSCERVMRAERSIAELQKSNGGLQADDEALTSGNREEEPAS